MLKDQYKKVYDPIHGFIRFDETEKKIIDSFAFQRLRYIHQLGGAYLVFPGATHSRFEHSLGVMELSNRIFKRICSSVRPDLLHIVPRKNSPKYLYFEKILRLAALCHDLGHLPFSHVAEKDLLKDFGHEKMTLAIIKSKALKNIFNKIKNAFLFQKNKNIVDDIIKIAIGEKTLKIIDKTKKYNFSNFEHVLSQIIIGDFFGADRIDYLLRDSKFTGLSYGLFDYSQLIESLRILPISNTNKTFALGIDENGIESCEALIFARHFMYQRVYKNPTVISFNFHLRNFIKKLYKNINLENLDNFLKTSDSHVIENLILKPSIDSKAILSRKNRFYAKKIPENVKEKDLVKFKKKNNIKSSEIFWEFGNEEKMDLSFPVSKNLKIYTANNCSKLLSLDLPSSNNWIFIAPEYKILLKQVIK